MKRLFSLLLISGLMLVNGGFSLAYTDTGGHWAKEYIDVISDYGVMQGYPNGSFNPDGNVTRAEVAKVLSIDKWGNKLSSYDTFVFGAFYDVAYYRDHWAIEDIGYVYKNGYMNGYPDQFFRPDNSITRAELSEVVTKYFEDSWIHSSTVYSDVKPEDWFYKSVLKSAYLRLMNGYPDGTFKPNQYVTRAELAKIMSVYHYDFYIPSPEEAANPYEWNPGVKDIFEKRMVESGYVRSVDELVYREGGVYNGNGHYSVGDIYGNSIVGVNCKTGWYHG